MIFEINMAMKLTLAIEMWVGLRRIRHKFYEPKYNFLYFASLFMVIMKYREYFFINLDLSDNNEQISLKM